MTKIRKQIHKLTQPQYFELRQWCGANEAELKTLTNEQLSAKATESLAFVVSPSTAYTMRKTLEWTKKTPEEPNNQDRLDHIDSALLQVKSRLAKLEEFVYAKPLAAGTQSSLPL